MDTKGVGAVAVLVVFGLIIGVVGLLPAYQHNVAVQEGEPTTATVESTSIDVREDDDDTEYNPIVVYQYTVDGETYVSENTYPGQFTRWTSSRSDARSVVDRYSPGDAVTVHYDPANPSSAYLTNDGLPGGTWFAVAYAIVAVIAGIWLIVKGFKRWKQRMLITDTPTETVRALSMGPSEIKGDAVTEDRDPMRAPFSDEDCVVASYEIKEYEDDDDDDGGSWRTVDQDTLHVPFYIDDGTGTVLVEPHDEATFDLDPDDWSTTYVDSSDRGPAPIQEFVRQADDVGFPPHGSGKDNDRKYRQNLIRTDESVYIYGTVHPRNEAEHGAANEDRLVVRKAEEDGTLSEPMYMISDDSEKGLTNRRRWALWRAPVGGGFLVASLLSFIAIFGPDVGLTLPVVL